MWASNCNQWGLRGVVILCRDGWRRGSSQITLGFLVINAEIIVTFVSKDTGMCPFFVQVVSRYLAAVTMKRFVRFTFKIRNL